MAFKKGYTPWNKGRRNHGGGRPKGYSPEKIDQAAALLSRQARVAPAAAMRRFFARLSETL